MQAQQKPTSICVIHYSQGMDCYLSIQAKLARNLLCFVCLNKLVLFEDVAAERSRQSVIAHRSANSPVHCFGAEKESVTVIGHRAIYQA